MFGFLKKLFSKRGEPEPTAQPSPTPPPAHVLKPKPPTGSPALAARRETASKNLVRKPSTTASDLIEVPLSDVVERLPDGLKDKARGTPGKDVFITVPLSKVLEQLSTGAVWLTFGELRKLSPSSVFLDSTEQDEALVDLPLSHIVPLIDPVHLQRKADQRKVEVSAEILPLFGLKGEALVPPPSPVSADAPTPAPAAAPPSKPATATPVTQPSPAPAKPLPTAATKPATLPAPSTPKPATAPTPTTTAAPSPAAPVKPGVQLPPPSALKPPAPPPQPKPVGTAPLKPGVPLPPAASPKLPAPGPVKPPAAGPPKPSAPTLPRPVQGVAPKPATPAAPSLPKAPPPKTPSPASAPPAAEPSVATVSIPVSGVIEKWPENLRTALASTGTAPSTFILPGADIEKGLRQGLVKFTWKQLSQWLQPSDPSVAGAVPGDTELELPLAVLAPAFMTQYRPGRAQRKITVGDNIPDVFKGTAPTAAATPSEAPALAPSVAPPATSAPTPAPASLPLPPPPPSPPKPAPPKAPTHIGDLLGQPDKRQWSPAELVKGLKTLAGIQGAVVATPDGMLVAAEVDPDLNPQTLAAFLPQLCGRGLHYLQEMQLRPSSSITVETGQAHVWITQVGKVYLGILGRAGQPLPKQTLAFAEAALVPLK